MSGIFGFFNRNGVPAEREIADTMLNAISYWEPDARALRTTGPTAIGHAMLWNTPESKYEHLPLQRNEILLTMDARFDNRDELAGQLELPDRPMEQIGDSEFVLAAYRKWGEACPQHLLGDFAFAIWDGEKEQLFCARDHVGVKPFYYFANDDLFVFTNLLKPITSHPKVPDKPDEASLAKFLRPEGFYDERATFFKAVKKLPPASTLIVSKNRLSVSAYWDIDAIPPVCYETREAYLEHFRKLLEEAVKARLRTSYPVAAHLSGGLDSSSVAVMAARTLENRSQTIFAYNWAQIPKEMVDAQESEWTFAEQIANTENMHYERVSLTAEAVSELYESIDLFNGDTGSFWEEYLIRESARHKNIRTILSGWGGDQFASYDGYGFYSGLFRQGRIIEAVRRIYQGYAHKNHKILRTIHRSVREIVYPLFYRYMDGYYKKKEAEPDPFLYCHERFAEFARTLPLETPKFRPGAHGEQKYLLREGSIQKRLECWYAAGKMQKLEYSYPLLDKRIIEFSLTIPEALYDKQNGFSRTFFRDAIAGLIEPEIVWARKGTDLYSSRERLRIYYLSLKLWVERNRSKAHGDSKYIDGGKIVSTLDKYFASAPDEKFDLSSIVESIILFHAKIKKYAIIESTHREEKNEKES
jgi:asparagine synthase (glutamine-hydrolysing)